MFAPAPLTKADIERLRAVRLARQGPNASSRDSSPSPDLRRKSSSSSGKGAEAAKQKAHHSGKGGFSIFNRGSKQRFSTKPISTPVAGVPSSPEKPPTERKVSFSESTKTTTPVTPFAAPKVANPPASPFTEKPRRAPAPPPRKPQDALQTMPQRPRGSSLKQTVPTSIPPPLPEKEPRGQSVGQEKARRSTTEPGPMVPGQSNKSAAAAKGTGERPARPARAPTAPPASAGKGAVANAAVRRSVVDPNKRLSGVRGGHVGKSHSRTSSGAASIRSTFDELDELQGQSPRRATDDQGSPSQTSAPSTPTTPTSPTSSPSDTPLPWKRKKKGETMSMLLESGFFEKDKLSLDTVGAEYDMRVKVPPPLFSLPATPGSAAATPTEVYQHKRASLNARKRVSSRPKRSPLAQISTTSQQTNATAGSPGDLRAIFALGRGDENSPTSEGSTPRPQATQIHVRDGSVVTVTPPEMTAYQRHIYVQGPIRLSTPVIAPKKNSVASLEAFQEAIDKVYQESLVIPRRRSDDAVVDDVCEWFESFGFDPIGFDGDILMADVQLDEIDEGEEEEEDQHVANATEIITPVEARLAQEIVSRPVVVGAAATEESLRAKGKLGHRARASMDSRIGQGSGMACGSSQAGASILALTSPRPESFGPDALMAMGPVVRERGDAPPPPPPQDHSSSFEWDDSVSEMEQGASWTAPAVHVAGKLRRFLH